MLRCSLFSAALLAALALTSYSNRTQAAGDIDAAFRAFWSAPNIEAASKAVGPILTSGVDFETALAKLKAGRSYAKEKTGLIRMSTSVGGATVENLIEIPEAYDPTRKWELRVQLHGGVGRDLP